MLQYDILLVDIREHWRQTTACNNAPSQLYVYT